MPDRDLERWAAELGDDLRRASEAAEDVPDEESVRLRDTTRAFAPRGTGALRRSILSRGPTVVSDSPYLELQDRGGVVRARQHGFLIVPVKSNYQPGPGLVTIWKNGEGLVVRSGTRELWAVRRRQVLLRGRHFLARALRRHLDGADERVVDQLGEVTGG